MKVWKTPILNTLEIFQTENGNIPATYESNYAGKMEFNGQQWCVVSGFIWESGMSMEGFTAVERPYIFIENKTVYYEG